VAAGPVFPAYRFLRDDDPQWPGHWASPVRAENSVTSCDLQVLVIEAAESISSQRPNSRSGARGSAAVRRELTKRSVWTVGV